MCFPRKAGLGQYNTPREQWYREYRNARIHHRNGLEPDPKMDGTAWKAQLIVAFDRNDYEYYLIPMRVRLLANQIVDEILEEEKRK